MLKRIRHRLLSGQGRRSEAIAEPRQSAGFRADQNVTVFMANRFANGIHQVLAFYRSGFLDPAKVPIVFQYFETSFASTVEHCEANGIEWSCFVTNGQRPDISSPLILYPFNNPANASLVAQRGNRHVLLMHGESNKVALVKPIARLYDHVLVAGDLAAERLVEFGIMTQADIDGGRAIKAGTSVVGALPALRAARAGEEGALAYCPTWEGGNDDEDLCSLGWSTPTILRVAKLNNINRLVLRLHPHTGERLHPLRRAATSLVEAALSEGLHIQYAASSPGTWLEKVLAERFPAIEWADANMTAVKLALTDVSALEAMMDVLRIPVKVFVDGAKTIAAPKAYLQMCADRLLWRGQDWTELALSVPKSGPQMEDYYRHLIGYETDAQADIPESKRLDWLSTYVRDSKLWTG